MRHPCAGRSTIRHGLHATRIRGYAEGSLGKSPYIHNKKLRSYHEANARLQDDNRCITVSHRFETKEAHLRTTQIHAQQEPTQLYVN